MQEKEAARVNTLLSCLASLTKAVSHFLLLMQGALVPYSQDSYTLGSEGL